MLLQGDIISDHAHKQLKAPPSGYISAINVICGICVNKILQLILHQYGLFQLAQLFIHGNSRYCFPKCWNWQICHAHRTFTLPLCTLSYKLFPRRKLDFFSIEPNDSTLQYSSKEFHIEVLLKKELPSSHYVAYSNVAGTFYPTWCT